MQILNALSRSGALQLPQLTWAEAQSLGSGLRNALFFITDVGVNGTLWTYSNGLLQMVDSELVLAKGTGVNLNNPGDTAEHVLATATIPPGLLGLHGVVKVLTVWQFTNSANAKNPRIRFGASGAGTSASQINTTAAASAGTAQYSTSFANDGATNAQVGYASMSGPYGITAAALATAAIDTTAATDVVITAQLATATEQAYLRYYEIRVAP